MFDGVNSEPKISERLRQDMMPVSAYPALPPENKPVGSSAVVSPAPAAANKPPAPQLADEPMSPVVIASFREPVTPLSRAYLSWLALVFLTPSLIFWLSSLLYVSGLTEPLRAIVTTVPFILIVLLNMITPLVSMGLSWLVVFKTTVGTAGRATAKLVMVLSGFCLLALILWVVTAVV